MAQYEKAIQVAFQEVADGLAARTTYQQQLGAQRALVNTTAEYYRLAERRYRTGVDSYLTLLDAQRQLFSARQQLIGDRLNQLASEVNLYKALGGGWKEQGATAPNA
ncbi:Outer membrane protein OprM [compost metagenome]